MARAIEWAAENAPAAETAGTYRVRSGDTLAKIARAHGVSWRELARLNRLANPDLIHSGIVLRVRQGLSVAADVSRAVTDRTHGIAPAPALTSRDIGGESRAKDDAVTQANQTASQSRQAAPVLRANLPVTVDGRRFPAVAASTTVSEVLTISPAGLAYALSPIMNPEAVDELAALGVDQAPVSAVAELGILIRLDPQTLSVVASIPAEQRALERFSLIDLDRFPDARQIYPSNHALGLTTSLSVNDVIDDAQDPTTQLGFFGFANVGGLNGINLDFGGTFTWADDNEFRRDAIVAFMDRPERALRFSAGDLSPFQAALAGSAPILGLSLERSYGELQPSRIIRPTGRRSFLLDRPATVEIYANGALINRFEAGPGPVDLADIAVANLNNDVTIVVEDAVGRRELDRFSLANDLSLLAPGLNEFSVSAGVLTEGGGGSFEYSSDFVVTGYYTQGVSEDLTVSGHAAVSEELQNLGASAAFAAPYGVALVETAFTRNQGGASGLAVGLGYRAGNLLGPDADDLLTVRVDYESSAFATLDDPFSDAQERLIAQADYRFEIDEATSGQVAATYSDRHDGGQSAYFLTAGVTRRFGDLQTSVTGRVGRDAFGRDESGVFLSFSRLFGRRDLATATYDTSRETARIEWARNRRLQAPDFAYRLAWEDRRQDTQWTGQAAYYGTRFEIDARVVDRLDKDDEQPRRQSVLTRLQSGIAIADGSVAIGRDPGRGFFMFRRHPSLNDASLQVYQGRSQTQPLAQTDFFGPAVSPVESPYRPTELSVVVSGAPRGYDTGDNRYVVLPGVRSGVVVEVGSANYRSRFATIQVEGQPASLTYGAVVNLESGERTVFFTNRAGRASLQKLAPGRYELRVGDLPFASQFEVEEDDPALIDMGVVELEPLQ